MGRQDLQRLLEMLPGLGRQAVGPVELPQQNPVSGVEGLQIHGPGQRGLRALLPAVVGIALQGLPEEAVRRAVLVVVADRELAIAYAVEEIVRLPVIPRLGEELLRQAGPFLL